LRGQVGQAIADFDAAIKLNRKQADAYDNRGVTYWKMGEPEKAAADFRKALKIDPSYADAKENLEKLTVSGANQE